jgi:predicted nucleic acid-binding protein
LSKKKQNFAIEILSDFKLVENTIEDTQWAVRSLIRVKLAYNVDALDSLIAAASYRLQIPLYTRNLKHFKPLLEELAQKPYSLYNAT